MNARPTQEQFAATETKLRAQFACLKYPPTDADYRQEAARILGGTPRGSLRAELNAAPKASLGRRIWLAWWTATLSGLAALCAFAYGPVAGMVGIIVSIVATVFMFRYATN